MSQRSFYDQIGFDPRLEAAGLARLADLDVDGCRRNLGRLVAGLTLSAAGSPRLLAGLLLDLLLQVNRGVHADPATDADFLAERLALVERFTACTSAEEVREAFLSRLNRLLAQLGRDGGPTHAVVARARRHIDAHYAERVVLSSVAKKLNVSPNYLSRRFREQVGVTLTCYVQRKRVERARLLLAAGEGTIAEIAYRVGYRNYRDFYRNFVKLEGASPRAVRRRLAARPAKAASGSA